jgi:hypothetical protein
MNRQKADRCMNGWRERHTDTQAKNRRMDRQMGQTYGQTDRHDWLYDTNLYVKDKQTGKTDRNRPRDKDSHGWDFMKQIYM